MRRRDLLLTAVAARWLSAPVMAQAPEKVWRVGVLTPSRSGERTIRQFTLPELATAVQAKANVVIVVCNDRGYGAMRMHQQRRFGRSIASDLTTPDFAAVAHAFGARGIRAESAKDLGPALETALAEDRPVIIDVPLALSVPWR